MAEIPTRSAKKRAKKNAGPGSPTVLKGPHLQIKMSETQDRRRQALGLRRTGATYEQIANRMNVSIMTAHRYVNDAIRDIPMENAKEVKALAVAKLDAAEVRLNAKLSGPVSVIEHVRLELALVKIAERRARLEGHDAPTRTELTGRNGAPLSLSLNDLAGMTNAQLERVIADSIRGRASGGGPTGDESTGGEGPGRTRQSH